MLALLVATSAWPAAARAQSNYFLAPSVALGGMYDDNIFESATRPEADWLIRLSPALQGGYDSRALQVGGFVTLDMEHYSKYTRLNSLQARRDAALNVDYHPTARLSMLLSGNYDRANTPGELTVLNGLQLGLQLGRVTATVYTVKPAVKYRFSRLTSATAEYDYTNETLTSGFGGQVRSARLGGAQRLSERNTLLLSVSASRYQFSGAPRVITSNAVRVGWRYELGPELTVQLEAGPRDTDGKYTTDIEGLLHGTSLHTDWNVDYRRRVTTLIGVAGTVQESVLTARLAYWPTSSLSLELLPAYLSEQTAGPTLTDRELQLRAGYQLNRTLSLVSWYQMDLQHGALGGSSGTVITHHVVYVGFVLSFGGRLAKRAQTAGSPLGWLLPEPHPITQ